MLPAAEQTIGKIVKEKIDQALTPIADRLDKSESRLDKIESNLEKIEVNIDWLVGAFKKFDEEHTFLSEKVSEHSNDIDKLNRAVFKN